jgi:hypothetical protein
MDARRRALPFRAASGWEIAAARASASRWKDGKCAAEIEKFWNKPSGVTKQRCNDEPKLPWRRSKNLSGPIAKQNVWRCMVRDYRVMDTRAGIVAHAHDGDQRRAPCRPKADLTGFSGQSLRTKLAAREPNFGNPANELQFAIEACRTAAGFCYE